MLCAKVTFTNAQECESVMLFFFPLLYTFLKLLKINEVQGFTFNRKSTFYFVFWKLVVDTSVRKCHYYSLICILMLNEPIIDLVVTRQLL